MGGTEAINLTQLKKHNISIGRKQQLIINQHHLSKHFRHILYKDVQEKISLKICNQILIEIFELINYIKVVATSIYCTADSSSINQ